MRLRSIILTFAGCVLVWAAHPGAARSQPIQGFYVGAGAGPRLPFPIKSSSLEPGVGGSFDLNQAVGYDTQLSVGYALGDGWRFELEGTLGRGGIRSVSGTAFPATSAGAVRNGGFMVNALFDLDVRSRYVYPYLGLGVGYQMTRLDGFVDTAAGKPGAFSASGTTGAFAAQAIAGLSFPVPNMPGLSLTVDYRIMDSLGGGWYHGMSSIGLAPGSAPLAGSAQLHNQFDQTAMFGVRYAFNTPPPAGIATQAAAAPRTEAQSYQVVFDPNKTTLSDRAHGIVRDAARASTRQGTMRIAVTGTGGALDGVADRQALSRQRASTVVAALVAEGVPRVAILVLAAGDAAGVPGQAGDQRVEVVTR
jgi:outer membrane protein OmpA-like peptidoglycan-associated protein